MQRRGSHGKHIVHDSLIIQDTSEDQHPDEDNCQEGQDMSYPGSEENGGRLDTHRTVVSFVLTGVDGI